MKKIEIITKSNGNKKSQTVKAKSRKDLNVLLGMVNFYIIKDDMPDIDLTGSVTFKVGGEKKSALEVRDMIRKAIKEDREEEIRKTKHDGIELLDKDEDGRVIIHRRDSISFNVRNKNKDKNKGKKKKNNKDKKISKNTNSLTSKSDKKKKKNKKKRGY